MAKVLIIYGSETGNTKAAAEMIAKVIETKGVGAEIRDVTDTSVAAFDEAFDLFLLGVSTWGAVEDEVTENFKNFYGDMAGKDLSGRKIGVFGSGDLGYDNFCKAVDYVIERAREKGAAIVLEPLKFALHPSGAKAEVEAWAGKAAGTV